MPERSERKDAALHRKLILETAQNLFDAQGVDSVSMHQIAKTAGIGQGTLYRRYSCKGDLCIDLIMESFRKFQERLDSGLEAMNGRTVRDKLSMLLSEWIDYLAEKVQWMSAINTTTFRLEDKPQFYTAPPCVYMNDTLARLIEEGAESGEVQTDDVSFAAFYILSSLTPEAILFLLKERGYTVDQLKAHYLKHHLSSLFPHRG